MKCLVQQMNFVKMKKKGQAENIWRAQVILLVSAFDFFMHEITKLGVSNIFEGKWEKTQRYNNISMKLEVLDVALKDGEDNDWFIDVNGKYFPAKNGNYFPALFGK